MPSSASHPPRSSRQRYHGSGKSSTSPPSPAPQPRARHAHPLRGVWSSAPRTAPRSPPPGRRIPRGSPAGRRRRLRSSVFVRGRGWPGRRGERGRWARRMSPGIDGCRVGEGRRGSVGCSLMCRSRGGWRGLHWLTLCGCRCAGRAGVVNGGRRCGFLVFVNCTESKGNSGISLIAQTEVGVEE